MRAFAILTLVVACNGFAVPDQPREGAHPIANAGTGRFYPFGETITLDGSGSYDPDGTIVRYQWSVLQRPDGSTAEPATGAATTSFTPDKIGTYLLKLTVTDDANNTDTSEVRVVATGAILAVDAGPDSAASWLGTATLTGAVTTMPGFTPTYSWHFVSRPAGSVTSLINPTGLTPTFAPDATGTFVIALDARVGDEVREDTTSVEVTAVGVTIGSNIPAYTFTTKTDHILFAHYVGFAELVSVDPATGAQASANVGTFTPSAITVDSMEQYVAVGGPGTVVVRSASNLVLISERLAGGCTAGDITLPFSGRVDCFPVNGTIEPITSVSMVSTTTAQTPCPVQTPNASMSTDGQRLYIADGASSEVYEMSVSGSSLLSVVKHVPVTGSTPPIWALGTPTQFVLLGNGTALNVDLTVQFNLNMPVSAADENELRTELAVVSGATLKIFSTDPTHPLKMSAVLPSVNGEAPVARLVAYSANSKRLIVVAGTSAGDVAYTVAR